MFLDDVHHLPADELAAALGYLARRLERSRLIVAARRELPLPADAPTPVVTALGPLDAAATAQMAAALAERMAVPCPDLEPVWRATRGSPFEIQRLVRRAPGAVALLAHLGFTDAVDCYLLDRHGRRAASDRDLARERATRELFVDERDDVIVVRGGAAEIRGRPMLCALLSALAQARGQPVAPDALYRQVWRVAEYHPLHHRNALYVAINRLRASLREVLPEREVIERMRGGWRVTDEVDVCVALAVRAGAPNPQTM